MPLRVGDAPAAWAVGDGVSATFRDLPRAQARAFTLIAINEDGGHSPRVLAALVAKGLITRHEERGGMFTVYRYSVPLAVHMEWCRWCSERLSRRP